MASCAAGSARGFSEDRGRGLALQLEGSIGAADFGIGECGERVQSACDCDGAQEFLALQLGV